MKKLIRDIAMMVGMVSLAVIILLSVFSVAKGIETKPVPIDDVNWTLDVNSYSDSFTFVQVVTRGTADVVYRDWDENGEVKAVLSKGAFELRGSGFVIPNNMIMTAAHVVHPSLVEVVSGDVTVHVATPLRILQRIVTVQDYKSTSIPVEIFVEDLENDIAILKYKDFPSLKSIPYDLMFPLRLAGTRVAMVAHQRDEDGSISSKLVVKYGTVTDPSISDAVPREVVPWFNMNDFTLDLEVQPGDSGSPLFMSMGDKIYCVGIVRAAKMTNPYGGPSRISFAVSFWDLQKYFILK